MHPAGQCIYPASCVSIGGAAVLISGASGIGKSELALALIDRGAQLISDDQVALRCEGERLVASPAPNIAGQIEMRNLGLMPMPPGPDCPVALLIELNRAAPRWIERCEQRVILGVAIPQILLTPDSHVLPIKAEMALHAYGLKG
ncbi:HPr kinase/phosphorylase [Blastomonas fulva]|uniref:HPr kinase/phosphorylase n=1 Tax=Blastomonas fulva TaxID=1550728 RepID=UPI0025A39F37|nr:HPr kinase/phosphatase C-terminal domain-containing protein [Blastomonas fulva]MDM7967116.1 HPr kinase/phosphatase C-terminal domain-containing protein [Blastomonas fulva]